MRWLDAGAIDATGGQPYTGTWGTTFTAAGAGSAPVYQTSGGAIAGQPYLGFTAGQQLTASADAAITAAQAGGNYTVQFIAAIESFSDFNTLLLNTDSSSGRIGFYAYNGYGSPARYGDFIIQNSSPTNVPFKWDYTCRDNGDGTSTERWRCNGYVAGTRTGAMPAPTSAGYHIGSTSGSPLRGQYYQMLFDDVVLTDAQLDADTAYFQSRYGTDGPNPLVICLGDSRTAGYLMTAAGSEAYPQQMNEANPSWTVLNDGHPGENSNQLLVDFSTEVLPFRNLFASSVLALWGTVNDPAQGIATATTLSNLSSMITTAERYGFQTVICTEIDCIPSFAPLAEVQAITAGVLAGLPAITGTRAVCRLDQIPQLGTPGSYLNPTYFLPDGIHETGDNGSGGKGGGYALVAAAVGSAIRSLWPPSVAPTATATATGATLAANATGGLAPLSYAWSGTGLDYADPTVTNPTATADTAGSFTAILRVRDAGGRAGTGTASFSVASTMSASATVIPCGAEHPVVLVGFGIGLNLAYSGAPVRSRVIQPWNGRYLLIGLNASAPGSLAISDPNGGSATITFGAAVPAPPTVLASSGQCIVAWAAATGADHYKLYKNGTAIYSGTALTQTVAGLTNGTAYTFSVSSVDASGNESLASTAVTANPSIADYYTSASSPLTREVSVTPSDTVDLPFVSSVVRCTASGVVRLQSLNGAGTVDVEVTAGVDLALRATRIYATATTATGISIATN